MNGRDVSSRTQQEAMQEIYEAEEPINVQLTRCTAQNIMTSLNAESPIKQEDLWDKACNNMEAKNYPGDKEYFTTHSFDEAADRNTLLDTSCEIIKATDNNFAAAATSSFFHANKNGDSTISLDKNNDNDGHRTLFDNTSDCGSTCYNSRLDSVPQKSQIVDFNVKSKLSPNKTTTDPLLISKPTKNKNRTGTPHPFQKETSPNVSQTELLPGVIKSRRDKSLPAAGGECGRNSTASTQTDEELQCIWEDSLLLSNTHGRYR